MLSFPRKPLSAFICFSTLLAAALASGDLSAKVSIQSIPGGQLFDISIDGLDFRDVVVDGKTFTDVNLSGVDGYQGIINREGFPKVPVVRIYFYGDAKDTTINPEIQVIDLPKAAIVPVQPPAPKIAGYKTRFAFDHKAYTNDMAYPESEYTISPAGSIQGRERKLLTIHPIKYNAVTKRLSFQRHFAIEIHENETPPQGTPGRDVLVFVVGKQFTGSSSLKDYESFKRSLGYSIREIVVQDASEKTGPEQIRIQLKSILTEEGSSFKHAILIGDSADVPAKRATNINGVTDHYYRALDTADYATDINGPDIGVGRISAANEAQLEAILTKYKRYQQGIFTSDDWLLGGAFIATNDRYQIAEGSHNYGIDTYTKPADYVGIFPELVTPGGDKLYAITYKVSDAKVVDVMRAGRTLINYSGHGGTDEWVGPHVSQSDIRTLTHPDALPFVVSNACVTGQFTVDESFGETWQRHPQGAVMFWGSMDSTMWDEDDILERSMLDAIYRDKTLEFSAVTSHALSEVWKHYGGEGKSKYYWETYVTFGDPSIRFRSSKINSLWVDGPMEQPAGLGEISFAIKDTSGSPVSNARVTLALRDSDYLVTGLTNQAGQVTLLPSQGLSAGSVFDVVVYADNTRIYRNELKITASNVGFYKITDIKLDGLATSTLLLGQTLRFGFNIKNIGSVETKGGQVFISSVAGPARNTSAGSATIPPLAPDASYVDDGREMAFTVNQDAIPGQEVTINLQWQTAEGQVGHSLAAFKVLKGAIKVTAIDLGDHVDPLTSGIRPGDSGDVFLTVKNSGNEVITNAELLPETTPCINEASGALTIDRLEPGHVVRLPAPITVHIAANCQNGSFADVAISGHYQSAYAIPQLRGQASLRIGRIGDTVIDATSLNLPIPDGGPAIEKTLEVNKSGSVTEVGLTVKITHTYVGDLVIKLFHPDGTVATLRYKEGGPFNNVDETYGLGGKPIPELNSFVGKPIKGTWKVSVQDTETRDSGTLNDLKLTIRGYMD